MNDWDTCQPDQPFSPTHRFFEVDSSSKRDVAGHGQQKHLPSTLGSSSLPWSIYTSRHCAASPSYKHSHPAKSKSAHFALAPSNFRDTTASVP